MFLPFTVQILRNGASHEQDHYHCCSNPERTVQVRVAFHDVQEVLARIYCGATSVQDLVGVDIEELLVEREAPEVTLGGGGSAAAAYSAVRLEKGG